MTCARDCAVAIAQRQHGLPQDGHAVLCVCVQQSTQSSLRHSGQRSQQAAVQQASVSRLSSEHREHGMPHTSQNQARVSSSVRRNGRSQSDMLLPPFTFLSRGGSRSLESREGFGSRDDLRARLLVLQRPRHGDVLPARRSRRCLPLRTCSAPTQTFGSLLRGGLCLYVLREALGGLVLLKRRRPLS